MHASLLTFSSTHLTHLLKDTLTHLVVYLLIHLLSPMCLLTRTILCNCAYVQYIYIYIFVCVFVWLLHAVSNQLRTHIFWDGTMGRTPKDWGLKRNKTLQNTHSFLAWTSGILASADVIWSSKSDSLHKAMESTSHPPPPGTGSGKRCIQAHSEHFGFKIWLLWLWSLQPLLARTSWFHEIWTTYDLVWFRKNAQG